MGETRVFHARCRWVGGVVLALVQLAPQMASGQAGADGSAVLSLLPALRTAPAPQWVKAGIRLTYYSAAASIPGRRHSHFRDKEGDWVDEQGRRYRRENEPSASGHGYTQVNVVALEQAAAVLDIRSYGILGVNGPPLFMSASGGVGVPAVAGDYWANPEVLGRAVGMQSDNTVVLRMPYTIQNTTYQAIRIQYKTQNSRMAYVFDEPSGVLLYTNSSVFNPGSQRTLLSYSSYRGTRTLRIPWAGAAPRAWLATVRQLQYTGSLTTSVPGSMPVPLPCSMMVQMKNRGARWLHYALTAQTGGVGGLPPNTQQSERVSGAAQLGGLWVPPQGLAGLRAGQVLDQDAFTRVTTSVSAVGNVVTISELGQGQRIDYSYDLTTGMLVAISQANTHLHMQRQLRLTGRE